RGESRAVGGLAGREHEHQRQPGGIDRSMDLASQSAPGPAERGSLRPRPAAPPDGSMLVRR
ncbi:hypothetical protein, partial [Nonomuraea pusilla]|uniref:hypothetical protein n=1 Tax=Nonomuraea pusilla TaxID=46177 RepID=UPI003D9EA2AA